LFTAALKTGANLVDFLSELKRRVLVFDGAMGTNVQKHNLTPEDFQGKEGCNELLVLSRPDVIRAIHASFLEAGCDVIETDSFGSTSIVLAEYDLQNRTRELNLAAARLARSVADEYSTPDKPRFVAGSIGPTTKLPRWATSATTPWPLPIANRPKLSSKAALTCCSSKPARIFCR